MGQVVLTKSQECAKKLLRWAIGKIGTNAAAASLIGAQESELSRCANPDHDRHHIHFSTVMELDPFADHVILKSWARSCGFELITREQNRELHENVSKLIGKSIQTGADFSATAISVMSDGVATNTERRITEEKMRRHIDSVEETVEAINRLRVVK